MPACWAKRATEDTGREREEKVFVFFRVLFVEYDGEETKFLREGRAFTT